MLSSYDVQVYVDRYTFDNKIHGLYRSKLSGPTSNNYGTGECLGSC